MAICFNAKYARTDLSTTKERTTPLKDTLPNFTGCPGKTRKEEKMRNLIVQVYRSDDGSFQVTCKGKDITLRQLRDEIDKLIQKEQDYRESMLMRARGAS